MTAAPALVLDGELLIYQVADIKLRIDALLASMDATPGHAPLCVQAEAMVDLDGAGMQLLGVLARECSRRGAPMQWSGLSHGMALAIEAAGMAQVLGVARGARAGTEPT